jgi:hypothetical protein
MKKLEARYRPPMGRTDAFIVVAHLTWEAGTSDSRPILEPTPSLMEQRAPATILATLRHLVRMTAPRSLERLASLRSPFWSFVAVGANVLTERADGYGLQDA